MYISIRPYGGGNPRKLQFLMANQEFLHHVCTNVADAATVVSLDMRPVIVLDVAIATIPVRSPSIGTTSKCEAD